MARANIITGTSETVLLKSMLQKLGLFNNTVLAVDFADPACYSGSGSTCNDVGYYGQTYGIQYDLNGGSITNAGPQSFMQNLSGYQANGNLSQANADIVFDSLGQAVTPFSLWVTASYYTANNTGTNNRCGIWIPEGSTRVITGTHRANATYPQAIFEVRDSTGPQYANYFDLNTGMTFPRVLVSVFAVKRSYQQPYQTFKFVHSRTRLVTSATSNSFEQVDWQGYYDAPTAAPRSILYCIDPLYCAALITAVDPSTETIQALFDALADRFGG